MRYGIAVALRLAAHPHQLDQNKDVTFSLLPDHFLISSSLTSKLCQSAYHDHSSSSSFSPKYCLTTPTINHDVYFHLKIVPPHAGMSQSAAPWSASAKRGYLQSLQHLIEPPSTYTKYFPNPVYYCPRGHQHPQQQNLLH